MPSISFLGAAETVTGSKYLLRAGNSRVLIDCGLFQGAKELRLRNWQPLPFDLETLDSVVLTHAHVDHVGYLPRLAKEGFRGPAYCTAATARLCQIQLLDCAKCQEEDARYANRKGFSRHHPALPLYDADEAERALRTLRPVPRGEWFSPAESFRCRFTDVGHLLGSSMVEVELQDGSGATRLLFSGDVGRYNAPLYFDPSPPPDCDYLICESTYGDRDHPLENVLDQLAAVVHEAIERGGVMLISAFAIGRSQQLIYLLKILIDQQRIPPLPIYLDSPMAVDATDIYCEFAGEHDLSEWQLQGSDCLFRVNFARGADESKAINAVRGPAVIIASSGMMTGGRILHHLRQRLPNPRNTVILGGFQPAGTRGRSLLERRPTLRIHGMDVPVQAAVATIPALSGHADRGELMRWLAPLPPPRQTFITHGELPSATAFAEQLRRDRGWSVVVPKQGQTFDLPTNGPFPGSSVPFAS